MDFETEYMEEDLQDSYDYFFEVYSPKAYEISDENRKWISTINPKLVWTLHTTCEDTYISPGFLEFSPSSCCWKEYTWYVSETPWKSDLSSTWVRVDHIFSCPICNQDGSDSGNFDQTCELCEGEGWYRFRAEG